MSLSSKYEQGRIIAAHEDAKQKQQRAGARDQKLTPAEVHRQAMIERMMKK